MIMTLQKQPSSLETQHTKKILKKKKKNITTSVHLSTSQTEFWIKESWENFLMCANLIQIFIKETHSLFKENEDSYDK